MQQRTFLPLKIPNLNNNITSEGELHVKKTGMV